MKKNIFIIIFFYILLLSNLSYTQNIPTNGLVAYYPFSGNTTDESGNGHDLTNFNAELTTDRFGNSNNAFFLNGTNSYLKKEGGLDFTIDFTFSIWLKNDADIETLYGMAVAVGNSGDNARISLAGNPTKSKFDAWLGGWTGIRSSNNDIKLNEWNHVVGIRRGNIWEIYLNGILDLSTTGSTKILTNQNISVGKHPGQWMQDFYNGCVDDIRIYYRDLELEEIQELYHEGGWDQPFEPISYCIAANKSLLLDNHTNILSVNTNELVTAEFNGLTNIPMNGAFTMYWDKNLGHLFTYNESGSSIEFTPGTFNNQGYKFAPFLVDWGSLNDNTGEVRVDLSTNQSTILQTNNAILLDNFPQFPIIGNFEDGKTYKVDISGSPRMPMQGVFVMYVDNGITKFDYIPIGSSLTFEPGIGTHKFCAFQVDWSTVGDNYGETCIDIYETDPNTPPIADAGEDQTIECDGLEGTLVTLDACGSTDPDEDELTYTWYLGEELVAGPSLDPTASLTYGLGSYTFTLVVYDGTETASDEVVVDIIDTTPPVLTVNEPITLWPANHKYVTVDVTEMISSIDDGCSGELLLSNAIITLVTSDEPEDDNGNGDGKTVNDIVIANGCSSVDLRAERAGGKNGRVYTVTIAVSDISGNVGYSEFEVHVPHDKNDIAVKDDSQYLVEGTCEVPLPSEQLAKNSVNDKESVKAEIIIPTEYQLSQNYPNPFNPTTNIQFSIPEANHVSLKVYDLLGKEIAVLVDETKSAGNYTYAFNASNLSSGVYVYRLQAGEFIETKKLVLMK